MDGRPPSLAVLFSSWLLEPWKQALEVEPLYLQYQYIEYSILSRLAFVRSLRAGLKAFGGELLAGLAAV